MYVLWLDIMGIQSIMSRSLPISANFIFKFHSAALQANRDFVEIYPVMDGLYAVTDNQDHLRAFVKGFYEMVARAFISEDEHRHRFVVRGGMAYGPTIKGAGVSAEASPTVGANPDYAKTVLLGMPVIQAHTGDRDAPPFGVFVNESARAFGPLRTRPFNETWWRWYDPDQHELAVELRAALDDYYGWCMLHSLPILYEKIKIEDHQEKAHQYLPHGQE
jgi:hypothetical protein